MVTRLTLKRVFLGRDVSVAFAVIVALYLVGHIMFQPIQIPAYLLIVAYDLVEIALPVLTPYYPVTFPVFLYLLAIVGAAATRWFRLDDESENTAFRGIGGVCLVVGSLSLLFGAYIGGPLIDSPDNPTPLTITGVTGVVLLVLGLWLVGHPTSRFVGTG